MNNLNREIQEKGERTRGFALITTYLMLSTILAFAFAIFARGNTYLQAVERNKNKIVAFQMAEAGTDDAITQLKSNSAYTGTSYASLNSSYSTGGYSVTVTIPKGSTNIRKIQVTGYGPDNTAGSRAQEQRTITTYVQLGTGKYFDFAAFAKEEMEINGNPVVDSYDSSLGDYSSSTAKSNGTIGTDSTAAKSVELTGNATVKGDAIVGPNGDPNAVITMKGNSTITGTKSAETAAKNYQVATTTTSLSGSIDISGNTVLTLAAGTYHYSSIKISGNAQLAPLGAVTLYVDGKTDISGNGITTVLNKPTNFLLFSSGDEVKISGNGNFYGGVYAPLAEVKVSGNGSVYGSIVSNEFEQSGNGSLHFDEALKNAGGSNGSGVSVLAWQEENTSNWGIG